MQEGIFDTHTHYDHERYDYIRHAMLSGMPEFGVSLILNCGSDEDSSVYSAQLAEEYGFVYASAGIHPHEASTATPGWERRIAELLSHPKMVAVGEIGLDYYYNHSDPASQRGIFTKAMEIAVSLNMPVIVHDRDAHDDILAMLGEYRPRGVVHRFSGTPEMAERLLEMGLYLGFGCSLTYEDAINERNTVTNIPVERLLLETDCPYLSPRQFKNEICRSDMLIYAAEIISDMRRDYTAEQIINIARENGISLFNIPQKSI